VIALITEWRDRDGTTKERTEKSDLGGTNAARSSNLLRQDDIVARTI
jgi:hypothetical protein